LAIFGTDWIHEEIVEHFFKEMDTDKDGKIKFSGTLLFSI
jgi:Ca2+-binding EF-hand superfamily protein